MSMETEVCLIDLTDRMDGKSLDEVSDEDMAAYRAATQAPDGLDIVLECQISGCYTEMRARVLGKFMVLDVDTVTNHLPCDK